MLSRQFYKLGIYKKNYTLYLSVRMCSVIGQFCGPYFTVQHTKLQLPSFPARPINLRDIILNITLFAQPALQVTDPHFSCSFMAL